MNFKAADTGLMAHKHVFALTLFDVPDAKCGVARTRNSSGGIGHLQTTNCGSMPTQHMQGLSIENGQRSVCYYQDDISHLPSRHVPNADISVAAT